jgi:uncharacterized protein YecT (DUF1311 family)
MYPSSRVILSATVLFLAAGFAHAQDETKCNPDGDTSEMAACAEDDYQAEDAKLNKVYAKYLKKMQAMDVDMGNSEGDTAVGRLKTAQRAWIAFRDAECPLESVDNMGGSIERILGPSCLAALTKERTAQLQSQLKAMEAN